MSYNFSFADNAVYSAADVNKITSRLVTAGVEDPFTDGVPYNLSAINEAGTLIYTEGVVPETVNTLKVTRGTEEGTVLINPGTAFFADGSVIEIESGGETLSYTAGMKHYVYLKNDLVNTNTSYPVCSAEEPAGDFVLLAEVAEDGAITDKRTYARGKLPGYASNSGYPTNITDTVDISDYERYTYESGSTTILTGIYKGTKTYNIGNNNYRYVLSYIEPRSSTDNYSCLGFYNLTDGSCVSFAGNDSRSCYDMRDGLYLYHDEDFHAWGTFSITGSVLTANISCYNTKSRKSLPVNLYLV